MLDKCASSVESTVWWPQRCGLEEDEEPEVYISDCNEINKNLSDLSGYSGTVSWGFTDGRLIKCIASCVCVARLTLLQQVDLPN